MRNLIASCGFLILAGGSQLGQAEATGSMEGHLTILPHREVDLRDDGGVTEPLPPEMYAEYPLIILSEEGKQIAKVTADDNGDYHISLLPGNYVLDAQRRAPKRVRARPRPFTVTSNQTVRVDMEIDPGVR